MSAGLGKPWEAMNMKEREEEGEKYSIHIRRKLLCRHQPFSGKHKELVCVAGGGYNCPDMGIVSMDGAGEEGERREWGEGEW